ncbi:spore coat protein [Paenibacillus senegalensis]|uniref:spore coat protein n=1 Tax=Paenibacillus senegalensis TaxID=1465766 RepID=UPI000289A83C|nr:spore coat protein [Paenibacillus senegalensis]
MNQTAHLAWHETLEMHELVAFQSNGLMGFKMDIHHVTDPQLKKLYEQTIRALEQNLRELLPYYQYAPSVSQSRNDQDLTAFYAMRLLIFTKTAVRNYAIAITETATPSLRELLQKQLNQAIQLHADIYYFMYSRGLYPSYNLNQLLQNDQQIAKQALQL